MITTASLERNNIGTKCFLNTTHRNQAFSFNLYSVMVVEPLNVKNLFSFLHQNMAVGLKSDVFQMLFKVRFLDRTSTQSISPAFLVCILN